LTEFGWVGAQTSILSVFLGLILLVRDIPNARFVF
jgi:hypothetical protein